MSEFDFDTPVDRRGTASMKWDKYRARDVIPLWVADMDFRSPPAVIAALQAHVAHGVFGYTNVPQGLLDVIIERLARRYEWRVEPEWITWLPGLVSGLNVVCRAIGEAGDDVLTATPIYPPFLTAPKHSRRAVVTCDLVLRDGRWQFDFERLEAAITPRTKLLMLCNPHNPVGRAYARDELLTLAAIAERHDLTICSDEIHCELILDADKTHMPIAGLAPDIARRTITLLAPSKTFNVPALGCAFAVIADQRLRRQVHEVMARIVPSVNALGYTAALAAYRDSAAWHDALLDYLRGNRERVERAIAAVPALSLTHVEATYLAWIDARSIPGEGAEPVKFFERAGVGLYDGRDFGAPGFVRLNFACPRALLEQALARMRRAVN